MEVFAICRNNLGGEHKKENRENLYNMMSKNTKLKLIYFGSNGFNSYGDDLKPLLTKIKISKRTLAFGEFPIYWNSNSDLVNSKKEIFINFALFLNDNFKNIGLNLDTCHAEVNGENLSEIITKFKNFRKRT